MEQKPVRDPKSELDTIKEVNNKPDIEPVVIKSFKSKLHFIRDDYLDADIGIKGDIDSGLTAEQVQKRRAEGDVNEFPALEPLPFISRLFCCTSRPHTQDEYAAIARKHLSHTSKVIRNNKIVTIPREELVPGDILLLTKGDRVNADVKLLQITDEEKPIYVKMFLYTESKEPVLKEIIHSIGKLWDRQEFILAGSEVVSGAGRALVLAVGKNTAIGQIMTSFEQRMAPRLYRGSTETADTTNGLAGVKSA